jgi:hypothetical protein
MHESNRPAAALQAVCRRLVAGTEHRASFKFQK